MDKNKLIEKIKKSNFTVAGISHYHEKKLLSDILQQINFVEVTDISRGFNPKAIIRETKLSQLLDDDSEKSNQTPTHFVIHTDSLGLGEDYRGRVNFFEDLRVIAALNSVSIILLSNIYNSNGGIFENKYSIKGGSHPIMVADLCFFLNDRGEIKIYKDRFE